jgi:hypothetical protein
MPVIEASFISSLIKATPLELHGMLQVAQEAGDLVRSALVTDRISGGKVVPFITKTLDSARGMTPQDDQRIRATKLALLQKIAASDGQNKINYIAAMTAISDIYSHWSYSQGQREIGRAHV